jgi:type I restriction enzyme S subunit
VRAEVEADQSRFLFAAYSRVIDGAEWLPMGKAAPLVRRPVEMDPLGEYRELEIRSFGKGTFHKSPITGAMLGSKRIFQIEPGDLLFNIVFAWEGAVAVAQPQDAGRVGSHRFLTCVPKNGGILTSFLAFHFLTDRGLEDLGIASPGGAGRNRTLGIEALARIRVPIPAIEKQRWFVSLLEKAHVVDQLQAEVNTELDALLPSILYKAFRSEL